MRRKGNNCSATAPTSSSAEPGDVDIAVTLEPCEYAKLRAWIEKQDPRPTEAQAVRAFILAGLRLIDNS